jgi:hypothetical protein
MATPFGRGPETGGIGEPGGNPGSWSQPRMRYRTSGPTWAGYRAPGGGPPGEEPEAEQERPAQPGGPATKAERRGSFMSGLPRLRNIGHQLRTNPEAQRVAMRIFDSYDKSEYFRRAGMGAAIRYSLGLPQSAEHLRYWAERARVSPQVGSKPSPLWGVPRNSNRLTEEPD